jgi:hypothetical protein
MSPKRFRCDEVASRHYMFQFFEYVELTVPSNGRNSTTIQYMYIVVHVL